MRGSALQGRLRRGSVVLLLALSSLAVVNVHAGHADVVNFHNDVAATGWYPDQGALSSVVVPNGSFGQLYSSSVDGQVYAQPLVSNGTLLVATENDHAYGFDKVTGTQHWDVALGTPFHASDLACADLTPNVGVTSTPVVDTATGTEYLTAKSYVSGTSGPARYQMHALDVATGAERPGFPVTIAGTADNNANVSFNATFQLQRPGLLLLDGVVYAAFAGHCDQKPYQGWVIGVSTGGHITARWIAQASGADGAGIWQSGGALLSDGPRTMMLTTGNGHIGLTGPTDGDDPPGDLSEAIVRLNVDDDGELDADDFFTPYDAPSLDYTDSDFGSGGPVALPSSYNGTPLFGTHDHPHLTIEEGKAGYVYLLDRDDLGGYREGVSGGDAALARLGPLGGVWTTPAVWPGDGGYIYMAHGRGGDQPQTSGLLRAYKYGVDGNGNPTLAFVASADDSFGFGSGAPVVTSDGLTSGSALLWIIWQPDGSGVGAQLRAYDAKPVNGHLNLRWSAPIGTATKFAPPAVSDNRVYVGTRDGHVIGFGSPVDQPFSASPTLLNFPNTIVNQSAQLSLTLHANHAMTVTGIGSTNPAFALGAPTPALPTTVAPGDEITVPVHFAPATRGAVSGAVSIAISGAPNFTVSTEGIGQLATGDLAVFPDQISFGGATIGRGPQSQVVTFSNLGAGPMHVSAQTLPAAGTGFTVTGLPAVGATIAAGQDIAATVTFTPTVAGSFSSVFGLNTDAPMPGTSSVTVGVSASAGTGPHLVVDLPNLYFGAVRIGTTKTLTFTLRNTGGTTMTITKSKPPASNQGFTALSQLNESATLQHNGSVSLQVAFHATTAGHFTDTWVINGDDDTGLHTITFDAYASPPRAAYWMLDPAGRVYGLGDGSAFTVAPAVTARAVAIAPTITGRGVYVVDGRGGIHAGGDAVARGSIPVSQLRVGEQAATMSVTPSGLGYWIFTTQGRVFAYGDAHRFGDLRNKVLNGPIVASVATPTGLGYYMVGSDGGVFTFGDAHFFGSTGNKRLNKPVIALVPTATGRGYWLAATDGGVFTFGDATFRGSMGGRPLNAPVCGMVSYGNGYVMVASDGGIFDFSNARFVGSLALFRLPLPIIGVGAFSV